MLRSLFFVALILCGNTYAKRAAADMSAAKMSFAPPAPTYPISLAAVQAHYEGLKKTRALTADEITLKNLAAVAATLKVESITSPSQDVASTQLASIRNAIIAKMKEHPKWDVSLSAAEVKAITPHLELLKTTFGEKSYGQAWFLKQTGKTAETKQLLTTLFNERCAGVMKMTETNNFQSPLLPVIEVEQALMPLSTESEKVKLQKKMLDVKVHASNLKEYMIHT